ncbi:MAG: flagellar hook-basal body complex protein FliE [Burkholderiaceae bacterium]|nr:flagellar hook-basal body complex protein FliE [Burkholderiaceae bacterium]
MSAAIDFLPPLVGIRTPQPMDPAAGGTDTLRTVTDAGFSQLVATGLQAVNSDWMRAQQGLGDLAQGGIGNLHEVMIRLEESRTSFQLFLQVRNRLVESYQDLMRMQI